jgi:nicotinate phosphoribosyltransferase
MIATKANRVVNAARKDKGREAKIVDFGLRRAQGEDAGMKGARAAYIAGAAGTSNVKAGLEYGLPIVGTHAHSFVMSFPSELEAFRAYTKTFPDNATLLIDTYDTVEGAQNAAIVAKELEFQGHRLGAVRLDSGDLADLSKKVRRLLDDEGLQYVRIVASNDLNENKIAELVSRGAPIDAYGVGTEMITAKPVAAIPGVYKIVEDNDGGKMKHSTGKKSHPGKHQVYRMEKRGAYTHDVIALEGESIGGKPLLEQVIKDGARVRPIPTLNETREHVRTEVAKFHHSVRDIGSYRPYDVKESDGLQRLTAKLTAKHLYTPEELALSYA